MPTISVKLRVKFYDKYQHKMITPTVLVHPLQYNHRNFKFDSFVTKGKVQAHKV
jgi:hypothetical protein